MEIRVLPPTDAITRIWPRVRGAHINVYQAGHEGGGAPLLLLHGGGLDSALLSWGPHLATFAATRRVLAPDLPGYGASETPDAPCTLDWSIGVLAALMDSLGIARTDLCGISLGGGIALGFTLTYPERVRKLVLASSYGLGAGIPGGVAGALVTRLPGINALSWRSIAHSSIAARRALRTLLVNPEAITDDLVAATMAAANQPRAGVAWTRFQRAETGWWRLRTTYRDRLPELAAPTLLLHGADDRLVPLAASIEAHTRIPDSRLHVFPHCGHWLPRDQPERFRAAVTRFLA